MKIWMVNAYAIPPDRAGGTRHWSLARHMVKRGHEVTIFSGTAGLPMSRGESKPPAVQEFDGVTFRWIDTPVYAGNGLSRVQNMLGFRFAILENIPSDQPDIVLGSSPHLIAANAAAEIARRKKVPFVAEIRDIWPQSLVDLGMPSWHPFVVWQAGLERKLYKRAKGLVTLLPGSVPYFLKRGFREDQVLVVPNGIDLEANPPSSEASEGFEILYAGSHGVANNLILVVEAAKVLAERAPDITITLLGDGPTKGVLQEQGQGLPNLRFEDPVPKTEVHSRLAKASVLLHILSDAKVFQHGVSPNKMFDYMAAGKPVIVCANVEGSPIQLAEAGVQVPAGNRDRLVDAILAMRDIGPDARRTLGENGRRYVAEHHDLAKLSLRLEEFLLKMAG